MSRTSGNRQSSVLCESELADLRDAFELFDTEKKGRVIVGDLLSVLKEIQDDDVRRTIPTNNRLQAVLQDFTVDDALSLDDFIQLFTTPNPSDSRDELTKVFDLFDQNQKGFITSSDLRNVADQLGESVADDELSAMIQFVAKNGRVTISQFADLMQKKI